MTVARDAPARLVPQPGLSLSVLVVTWNSAETLEACLASLRGELSAGSELLVLDNHSLDKSPLLAEDHGARVWASTENMGFARGMNRLAAEARGDVLVLVNPDVLVEPGALDALVRHIDGPQSRTIVGGLLVDANGAAERTAARPLPTAVALATWLLTRRGQTWQVPSHAQAVSAVSGAFFALTRAFWRALGGFDEDYLHSGEDLDLYWRAARAGGTVWFEPDARATHVGGVSVRQAPLEIDALRVAGAIRLVRRREGSAAAWLVRSALLVRSAGVLALDTLRIHRLSAGRRARARAFVRLALHGERRPVASLPLEPERSA